MEQWVIKLTICRTARELYFRNDDGDDDGDVV